MITTQTIIIYYLPFDKRTEDGIVDKCKKFKEDFKIPYDVLPSFTGQEGYVTIPYEVYIPDSIPYQHVGPLWGVNPTPTHYYPSWVLTSTGNVTVPPNPNINAQI